MNIQGEEIWGENIRGQRTLENIKSCEPGLRTRTPDLQAEIETGPIHSVSSRPTEKERALFSSEESERLENLIGVSSAFADNHSIDQIQGENR